MKTADIQIRDPFVVPEPKENAYYLFGTTDKNCWRGPAEGFDCYRSKDLREWEGPIPAFRPPASFWATQNFWAPEVHRFGGRYYMFASFKAERRYRGTQILSSAHIAGPYAPLTDGPITPPDWYRCEARPESSASARRPSSTVFSARADGEPRAGDDAAEVRVISPSAIWALATRLLTANIWLSMSNGTFTDLEIRLTQIGAG
jgi:hypothetical protein